ncbi:hypothetical protein F53441_3317 [Fusarium austroafricanum]|uniref:Prolyl 4-hydroxylase alpha subunit Fe(2+) 2OG dioxygenase domain-containing protein n=1 Tax=Fusarium austroafricanum TaxID=2364996 RepID=A0A8H4KPG0_9HYPO|nr:hypothetical protein F53441_3317 [Fusarium austroafricanum]
MVHSHAVIEISDDDDGTTKMTEGRAQNRILKSYQEFANPSLKIQGHQTIPLPLTDHYAEVIKSLCNAAQGPGVAGKNVWEFDHSQFDLTNPVWPSCLDRIAMEIAQELRMDDTLISLEKIGTLFICLPSEHQGGNIHLSIGDRKTNISTANSSMLDLSAIGWFSDTDWEAKELVSGYRLTVSYAIYDRIRRSAPSSGIWALRVAEVLRLWPRQFSGTKILYKLDDEKGTGVLSLKDAKGRDRAVCQALAEACSEAGFYMLFAEITHEITDDVGSKTINSSVDGLYTPDCQCLAKNKQLDPEQEVLGFDVDQLWDSDPGSDDDEYLSNRDLIEEHEMIRRWHDSAVLLIPKEEVLNLVRPLHSPKSGQITRNTSTQGTDHQSLGGVVIMSLQNLEKSPGDMKAIKVAANIISTLCGSGDATQILHIKPIVLWSLKSGDLLLYTLALRIAPMPAVSMLAEHLAKRYNGSEDTIDWQEWLDDIPEKTIKDFRSIYPYLSQAIMATSQPVSKSFEAWAESVMDEKLESELNWDFRDLGIIIDWIHERFQHSEWIINRLLPIVASGHHNQSHGALLIHLLFRIFELRSEPQFTNAKEMFQAIVKNSGGELNFPPDCLEPKEEVWSTKVPRHDLICEPFVRLITECHLVGATKEASAVLSETFSNMARARAKWILVRDPFGVIYCLLTPLIRLFAEGRLPTVPIVLEVLELLIRKVIRLDLHKQSLSIAGCVFRERGCGFCDDCAELNQFLVSPEQLVWEFTAPADRKLHIEHAIGMDSSLQVITVPDFAASNPKTLRVTKIAAQGQPSLQSWDFNYIGLKKVLQPLEGDFMKRALGEQRYREIILLEDVTPYPQPPNAAGLEVIPNGIHGCLYNSNAGAYTTRGWLVSKRVASVATPHSRNAKFRTPTRIRIKKADEVAMSDSESVEEISDDSSDESSVPVAEHNRGLLQALNSIQSAGKISTFNNYSAFVNPGLTIEGDHLISLLLKEDDAKLIKGVCRQTPFGHGDKTFVDTSVRDTWELDASKLELSNPQWPSFFDGIPRSIAAGLGVEKVAGKPHKLLLYEPGSFFKPHKDSEKEKDMIGTLVIFLPSQHGGADVKLSFGSQAISYSTAPTSKFNLTSISCCDRAVAYSLSQGEGEYDGYDDGLEEDDTTLKAMYDPNGGKVALGVSIDVDEILGYSVQKDLPDSEDEGEFTGNESAPATFRYHKTVIVLVPKDRVQNYLVKSAAFAFNSGPRAENDRLAEMVCQDLANNPDDPYTKQVVTAFMAYILHLAIKPAEETVGLISKWALRLNDVEIFRTCIKATNAPLGSRPLGVDRFPFGVYRKYISRELVSYLRTHFDGNEKDIDWGHWLQGLIKAYNIATEFNAFCVLFESSTDHQPLLQSFKAWAGPIADASWTISDEGFIFNTLKSRNKSDSAWFLESQESH